MMYRAARAESGREARGGWSCTGWERRSAVSGNREAWMCSERVVDHEIGSLSRRLTKNGRHPSPVCVEPPEIERTVDPRAFVAPRRISSAFSLAEDRPAGKFASCGLPPRCRDS